MNAGLADMTATIAKHAGINNIRNVMIIEPLNGVFE